MNSCAFVGRLTATPELKQTASGKNVCSFSLAVERRFSSGGEKVADYIDFVAWNHHADFLCKWFDKGVRVAVTGELQTRTYDDKDGKKVKVSEIIVNTIEFADGKRDANATPSAAPSGQAKGDDIFDNPVFANEGFMPIGNDDNPFGE